RRTAQHGGSAGDGRGHRHPGRGPGPDLRSVLHDQGPRAGPRPGHLPPGARATPRRHPDRQRRGPRDAGHLLPADRQMSARILVADDEDSLRWVLEKGLHQAGYDVKAVKDGDSAIRALEAEAFDLVFLDIKMPGIDGLTALVRLRQIRADVQVVMITAHG